MSGDKPIASFDAPKLEALVEIMFHAATSDGEFSDVERAEFKRNVESLTDSRLEGAGLDALIAKVEKLALEHSREERLASLKAALGSPHLCTVALELAIRVVAADGILRTSERELLFDIAEGLHIDRDKAADLVASIAKG